MRLPSGRRAQIGRFSCYFLPFGVWQRLKRHFRGEEREQKSWRSAFRLGTRRKGAGLILRSLARYSSRNPALYILSALRGPSLSCLFTPAYSSGGLHADESPTTEETALLPTLHLLFSSLLQHTYKIIMAAVAPLRWGIMGESWLQCALHAFSRSSAPSRSDS